MTDLERQVWASAFVAEFSRERRFLQETPIQHGRTIDDIGGFSCAEVADVALAKFREAMACEDAQYLTPVKEGWRR